MKRIDLLAVTLVFPVALGIGSALRGADPVPQCPACSGKETTKTTTVKATKEKLVQELVAILNETKSPDTFIVTTSALGMMGHDARPAVPSIIRNADRLGLLKGISEFAGEEAQEAKPSKQQRIAEGIMDCLDQILTKQPGNGGKATYQAPLPPAMPLVCPTTSLVLPETLPMPASVPLLPPLQKPPHAVDFAFPVNKAPGDNKPPVDHTQVFSFFIGFTR
jgi:hypothetical protein